MDSRAGRRGDDPLDLIRKTDGHVTGMAQQCSEYREQVKPSREDAVDTGSSNGPQDAARPDSGSSHLPPAYAERPDHQTERVLESGMPGSADSKAAQPQYREDDFFTDSAISDDWSMEDDDEEHWEFDDAIDSARSAVHSEEPYTLPSYDESQADYRHADELVQETSTNRDADTAKTRQPPSNNSLPMPATLPQPRPRKNIRGTSCDIRGRKAERKPERKFEKTERKVLKYERRMDQGRDLSQGKAARYDAFMAERKRRGLDE
ncbi:hypothetical protein Tdes44962_MAKER04055 [Teratosphaeria destructans]|uniref:Uncharacterized protein n=1 Tax=Teratosphaeria destructans TaxID=418781 RepID=A0A9W7SNU3_9PEZI|nr:hypothetical protein Tdes44962_MAKER04055 [Teratosphaeria destructans]